MYGHGDKIDRSIVNKMNLPKLKCVRCGYEWVSMKLTNPKRCTKCGYRHWDESNIKKLGSKGLVGML